MAEDRKNIDADGTPSSYLSSVQSVTTGNFKDLGLTPYARQLGLTTEQTHGHWCKRCEGIWFGYSLEVQCPVCGNRSG